MRLRPRQLTSLAPKLRPFAVLIIIALIIPAALLVSSNAGASRENTVTPATGTFTASYDDASTIYLDTSGTPSGRVYGPYRVLDLGTNEKGKTLSIHTTLTREQAPSAALYRLTTVSVRPGEVIPAFGDSRVRHAGVVASAGAGSDLNWVIEPGRYLLIFPRQVPPVGVHTTQSASSFSYTVDIK